MEIIVVTDFAQLKEYRNDWDKLLLNSSSNHVFLTYEWISTWWEIYGRKMKPVVLFAKEDGEMIGIAPMCLEKERIAKIVPLKKMQFLGSRNVNSESLDFIIYRGKEKEVLPFFMDYLCKYFSWNIIALSDLESHSVNIPLLKNWAKQNSVYLNACYQSTIPYFLLPDSMEKFLKMMDHSFRGFVKKNVRKIHKKYLVEYEDSVSDRKLDYYIEKLFQIHSERWQTVNKAGEFAIEEKRQFYRNLAKIMSSRGWLKLTALIVDGNVDSVMYGLNYSNGYYALQMGCGVEGRKHHAGNVMVYKIIESLIANSSIFHFGKGGETYKYKWGCVDNHTINMYLGKGFKGWFLFLLQKVFWRFSKWKLVSKTQFTRQK